MSNLGGFNKSHSSFQALSLSGLLETASALREFKPSDPRSGRLAFFHKKMRLGEYPLLTTFPLPIYMSPVGCGSHLSRRRFSETKRKKSYKKGTKERKESNSHSFHNIHHPWIISMERISLPPHLHVFPDFTREEACSDKEIRFSSCNLAAVTHEFSGINDSHYGGTADNIMRCLLPR